MAFKCDNCERGVQYGDSHTHKRGVAGGRWKKKAVKTRKVFLPNLHKYNGQMLCTKCLRKAKNSNALIPKVLTKVRIMTIITPKV